MWVRDAKLSVKLGKEDILVEVPDPEAKPVTSNYRRVIFRHGIPVGGILLGSTSGMGELRKLIEGGIELEKLKPKIVPEETLAAAL